MQALLRNKPIGVFDHLVGDHCWVIGWNGRGVYALMAIELDGRGSAALHLHIVRWDRSVLFSIRADWEHVMKFLKANKCRRIVASNPDTEDKRWPKFIKYFGFPEPTLVWMSIQEV